jgi:hypothetical protein
MGAAVAYSYSTNSTYGRLSTKLYVIAHREAPIFPSYFTSKIDFRTSRFFQSAYCHRGETKERGSMSYRYSGPAYDVIIMGTLTGARLGHVLGKTGWWLGCDWLVGAARLIGSRWYWFWLVGWVTFRQDWLVAWL